MQRSTIENVLLTDYKVRNVGYGSELGFFF